MPRQQRLENLPGESIVLTHRQGDPRNVRSRTTPLPVADPMRTEPLPIVRGVHSDPDALITVLGRQLARFTGSLHFFSL